MDYEKMELDELKDYAKSIGLSFGKIGKDKLIEKIKEKYPDNAITLSIGERNYESYKKMFEAGADRYLLRHETASRELYESLHPEASFDNRRKCLQNLKDIGYPIGARFMVGLPNQGNKELVMDLRYLKELQPHMCGIGPFIPHKDTSLKDEKQGTVEMTTTLLAIIRLILPEVYLLSTSRMFLLPVRLAQRKQELKQEKLRWEEKALFHMLSIGQKVMSLHHLRIR